ncbi:MAG: hypothetical protein AAE986_06140 [Thermoplasmataceae archaeon]|jgi:hypothetical protein
MEILWKRSKDDATPISVLYPLGISSKAGPGKVKDFIEKKKKEGLDDETIEQLVRRNSTLEGQEQHMCSEQGKYTTYHRHRAFRER